jgi:hypothetical protein
MAEKHPGWYLREFAAEFGVCLQAIDKRFKALGITCKKNVYLFGKKRRKTRGILRATLINSIENAPTQSVLL